MMEADAAASVAALREGLDLGLRHIDTAEMYGAGRAEEIVAEAIAGRRDEVYLVSKVLPSHATYDGTLKACEQSLRRLKTDRLDLYLLHWRGEGPLEATFRAFERLKLEGKILEFGVSNFDVGDLEEAAAVSDGIICNQVLYHLRERAIEHAVLPWCEQRGIAVVAYSPLGEGDFPAEDPILQSIARAHRVSAYAVALAWLARRTFVIPKSSNRRHVRENAAAGELSLEPTDVERLDGAFPPGPPKPLPMI
jgi:diketogulonate reductase-like aldo/keto reductase